jgi:O-antigen/teichoic acid export membrane protein
MMLRTFAKDTLYTTSASLVNLGLGIALSVVLARGLGPADKGLYTMAALFPTLIITFVNLGMGPATVFFSAKDRFPRHVLFGNNTLVGLGLGAIGILAGLVLLSVFPQLVFPEVDRWLLALALVLVPIDLFRSQIGNQMLLGTRQIGKYNSSSILYSAVFLILLLVALVAFKAGVKGAIGASVLSSLVLSAILGIWVWRTVGGFSIRLDRGYFREVLGYGLGTYVGNVIGFLNYRIEILLLGALMPSTAIGFYSISVGLAERLWLVSQSASTMIFPVISAMETEKERQELTPLVSRNVLLITGMGATVLFFLSPWLIELLYSSVYLPSVPLFRVLLPGIVFISASRVLANDIAGRGKPILNAYVGGIGLLLQVGLNLWLVPRFGAMGSAIATTISYGLVLAARVLVYSRLSALTLSKILLPQRSDIRLYRRLAQLSWGWIRAHLARSKP